MIWIDVAKAVGISLVVFGHVWRGIWNAEIPLDPSVFAHVDSAIYLFHMPLFFALSGLLFEGTILRKGLWVAFKGRVLSLLYPLVLWSYITAAFLLVAAQFTNRDPLSIIDALLYPFPPKDIYWFLWALFVIQTLCAFLVYSRNTNYYYLALAVSFAAVLIGVNAFVPDIFANAVLFAPYFLLGMALSHATRGLGSGLGAVVGAAAFLAAQLYNFTMYPLVGVPLHLTTLIATVGFLYFAAWSVTVLPRGIASLLSRVGVASMAIYVAHIMALAGARIVLQKAGVENVWLHAVVGTIAGMVLPYVFYVAVVHFRVSRWFGLGAGPRKERPAPAKDAISATPAH